MGFADGDFSHKFPDGDKDFREYVANVAEEEETRILFLEPPYLDEAIVGLDEVGNRIIYDADLLIEAYAKAEIQDKQSRGEAFSVADAVDGARDCVYTDTVSQCEYTRGDGVPIVMRPR